MRLNILDKIDCAVFKRCILAILVMVFAITTSDAQGFFDGKKLDSPVPHICAYDNDTWRLRGLNVQNHTHCLECGILPLS